MHLSRRFSGNVFLFYVFTSYAMYLFFHWIISESIDNFELQITISKYVSALIRLLLVMLILLLMARRKYPVYKLIHLQKTPAVNILLAIAIAISLYFCLQLWHRILQGIYDHFNELRYATSDGSSFSRRIFFGTYTFQFWPGIIFECIIPVITTTFLYFGIMLSGLNLKTKWRDCIMIGLLCIVSSSALHAWPEIFFKCLLLAWMTWRTASILPALFANFSLTFLTVFNTENWIYGLFHQSLSDKSLHPTISNLIEEMFKGQQSPITLEILIIYFLSVIGLGFFIIMMFKKNRGNIHVETQSIHQPMSLIPAGASGTSTDIKPQLPEIYPASDIGKRQNVSLIIAFALLLLYNVSMIIAQYQNFYH